MKQQDKIYAERFLSHLQPHRLELKLSGTAGGVHVHHAFNRTTSIQILSALNGCDSIVVTTVTYSPADSVFLFSSTCDPAAAGVFTDVFANQNGCDSVVTETVTLLESDTVFLFSSTCDPTAAGVFTDVFANQNGCDSVVTETVSLLESDTTHSVISTCNPEHTGTQILVLANQIGCDSIVVVETIIDESLTVFLGVSVRAGSQPAGGIGAGTMFFTGGRVFK